MAFLILKNIYFFFPYFIVFASLSFFLSLGVVGRRCSPRSAILPLFGRELIHNPVITVATVGQRRVTVSDTSPGKEGGDSSCRKGKSQLTDGGHPFFFFGWSRSSRVPLFSFWSSIIFFYLFIMYKTFSYGFSSSQYTDLFFSRLFV